MAKFSILLTDTAKADLEAIKDARTQQALGRKIDELQTEPDQRGEPLRGELKAYRKLKAVKRYRIIYQVALLEKRVVVVVIGIRKEGDKRDAYEVARKRVT